MEFIQASLLVPVDKKEVSSISYHPDYNYASNEHFQNQCNIKFIVSFLTFSYI